MKLTFSRKNITTLIISLVLAFCCSTAYDGMAENPDLSLDVFFLVRLFVLFIFIFFSFYLFDYSCKFLISKNTKNRIIDFLSNLFFPESFVRGTLLLSLFLVIAWLPYLISFYPGNLYMDTSNQFVFYFEFVESGDSSVLNTHHPIFDTLVFGSIVDSIYRITGNFHIGIFVLTLLQVLFTSVSFSFSLNIARYNWKCSRLALLIILFFCAFCPIIPISVCSISKDSFFSWIYILFFTAIANIVVKVANNDSIGNLNVILLAISGFLIVLTKNYGFFVGFFTVISLLVFCKFKSTAEKSKAILPSLSLIVIAGILVFIIPRIVGITEGGPQEMLSVPFQQTAVTIIKHEKEIPEKEIDIISKVIDVENIAEDYSPRDADAVKGYSPKGSSVDYLNYLKVWCIEGLRYPKEYIEAWAVLESPVFSNTNIKQIFNSEWTSNDPILPEGYKKKSKLVYDLSESINEFYSWISQMPLLEIFFKTFTYAIFIPILFLRALIINNRRIKQYIPVLVMLGVSLFGIFLAPISADHVEAARYLLPFIYTSPVLIALTLNINHLFRNPMSMNVG